MLLLLLFRFGLPMVADDVFASKSESDSEEQQKFAKNVQILTYFCRRSDADNNKMCAKTWASIQSEIWTPDGERFSA